MANVEYLQEKIKTLEIHKEILKEKKEKIKSKLLLDEELRQLEKILIDTKNKILVRKFNLLENEGYGEMVKETKKIEGEIKSLKEIISFQLIQHTMSTQKTIIEIGNKNYKIMLKANFKPTNQTSFEFNGGEND